MRITREQATEYAHTHTVELLIPSKKKGKQAYYCCELCNSGLNGGFNSDGALVVGTEREGMLHCFSCGFKGDIFDYVAQRDNLAKGSKECFDRVYDIMGIEVVAGVSSSMESRTVAPKNKPEEKADTDNFTEQYKKWWADVANCSYLKERGISQETAKKYWLGYKEHYFTELGHTEKGLVIPTSKSSYVVRNTNKETEREQRYAKKGPATLFNIKALAKANKPIFIVEGELDALSILQVGGEAIGLGSTSNIDMLIEGLKKHKAAQGLILALDNDEAGQAATKDFFDKMKAAKLFVKTYVINIADECKDANELLVRSPLRLKNNVEQAQVSPVIVQYKQQNKSDKGVIEEFWERIHDTNRGRVYPTGFKALDDALGGGIGTGLTGMGAISGLGKTTLAVQIANNIAEAGTDVLFFTLELGRDELIAKSISRLTALNAVAMFKDAKFASTSRDILSGWKWYEYTSKKQDLIYYAKSKYAEYADNIYTIEGEMECNVEDIIQRVQEHIEATGKKPVVFVDYLQILGLEAEKNITDKMKADKLVKYLRIMARKFDIPVVAISSFNRENYNTPVNMSSFKESGGIEYTADALIGLQFSFMECKDDEAGPDDRNYKKRIHLAKSKAKEEKKAGMPLSIQAVVLKSRYSGGGKAAFNFLPRFNLFMEAGADGLPDIAIDEDLAKASVGKGASTAKDALLKLVQDGGPYEVNNGYEFHTHNRITIDLGFDTPTVIQAELGRLHEWYYRDVNTDQVFNL